VLRDLDAGVARVDGRPAGADRDADVEKGHGSGGKESVNRES
jgi:hypothetical protein